MTEIYGLLDVAAVELVVRAIFHGLGRSPRKSGAKFAVIGILRQGF